MVAGRPACVVSAAPGRDYRRLRCAFISLKPDFADLGYSNMGGLTVQHMRSQENLGHLRVVRPKGDYAGSLRKVQVTLDGEKLAALLPGEVFEADISAGAHVLRARMDWATSDDLQFEASPTNSVTVQVDLPFSGVFRSFFKPRGALTAQVLGTSVSDQ